MFLHLLLIVLAAILFFYQAFADWLNLEQQTVYRQNGDYITDWQKVPVSQKLNIWKFIHYGWLGMGCITLEMLRYYWSVLQLLS